MSIFRDFFVKEKPVFTGIARGVGGFGFGAGSGSSGPDGTFSASGGTKSTDGDFTFHYFTTSTPSPERNFTITGGSDRECDVIVCGGGGGGSGGWGSGGYGGGGGGGGGVTMNRVTLVSGTPYTVTIGAAGAAGPTSGNGGAGGDSTFGPGSPFPFLSKGGGAGLGNNTTGPDGAGGSGGGGGSNPSGPGPSGPLLEGTVPSGGVRLGTEGGRGTGPSDPYLGGGGGGATGSGGYGGTGNQWPLYPRTSTGGRGIGRGRGLYTLPTNFAAAGDFAGGGAGAGWSDTGPGNNPTQVAAFEGGGTARFGAPLVLAGAGTANSGGGGGGGSAPGDPADAQKGGAGGSGFVLVKYKTSADTLYPAPSSRTFADVSGGNAEITSGNRQYNIFLAGGTLTVNSPGDIYYLVVAGGGAGSGNGGGGGAGGVRCNDPAAPSLYNRGVPFSVSSPIAITVAGPTSGGGYPFTGSNGGTSSIGNIIEATGGGRGGAEGVPSPSGFGTNGGQSGGSGGGGGYPNGCGAESVLAPTSPDPGVNTSRFQGFPGQASANGGHYGGGGGSGYAGGHQEGSIEGPPGIGGDGAAFPGFPAPVLAPSIPSPVRTAWTNAVGPQGYFAGGGGGGDQNGGPVHPGGRGGGANGGVPNAGACVNYTGSGGGGSAGGGGTATGGSPGIVIIVTEV